MQGAPIVFVLFVLIACIAARLSKGGAACFCPKLSASHRRDLALFERPPILTGLRNWKGSRIGIVCLTNNPVDFRTWISHHKNTGIERMYVRVEDTPQLVDELRTMADPSVRIFCDRNDGGNPLSYFTVMDRQAKHVDEVIQLARSEGLTHLLHIDDDELLYFPAGKRTFLVELLRAKGSSVRLENIEAIYDASNCSNPFHTTTHFCIRPSEFTAYANGKSIGLLSDTHLRSRGPHMYSGATTSIPPHAGVIVHYESACLTRWAQKFSTYAATSRDACTTGDIPFQYYCDSMKAFANEAPTEHSLAVVWTRWKTRTNRAKDGIVKIKVLQEDKL